MAGLFHPAQKSVMLPRMVSGALKLALLGLLAAQVAQAQKVTVEFDKSVDFTKFKTFAIRGGELNSRNPALTSNLVKKQIESDIEQRLTAKGLTQTSGDADLNVRYTFGQARKVEVETYPAGWYGRGTRAVRVPYAEGTLVIDLRDPSTRVLVWRGVASDEKTDPAKLEGKIDDMVKKSIEKYPPKK
ncbi:MAG: DUF4136 domain-containing protein [Acidobacteriia bacterium]|nr:DUF4136 domain-containing protein [Terriglobia bacterium]